MVERWGKGWYAVTLSIVVGVMMVAYVAVPSRLVGIKSGPVAAGQAHRHRRRRGHRRGGLLARRTRLGRVAILMLGSHTFRFLAVILLAIAVVLQTGATTATKAIKFSAKLVVGHDPDAPQAGQVARSGETGNEADPSDPPRPSRTYRLCLSSPPTKPEITPVSVSGETMASPTRGTCTRKT